MKNKILKKMTLPKLLEKLDDAGIQTVIDEMQNQVNSWKEGRQME